MSHSKPNKLDELLADAVQLRSEPDFSQWREEHPEAVDALESLPTTTANRRSMMIRITRYSTSAAAVLLLVAVGAWWMFFSQGQRNAWAELIEQVAGVQRATCSLHTYSHGDERVSNVYLEGSRVRVEDSNVFHVQDFLNGKSLYVRKSSRTAHIIDMNDYPGQTTVIGSNPLIDLIQMKDAPAERLPDERIDDVVCQVYRVKDTTFLGDQVPWVKVWLGPDSKLPVQIHSVVGDREALTLKDFRWDEPFDEGLLELVVPEGYEVREQPKSEETPEDIAPPPQPDAAGQEIPVDEIAETLDMLAQRIEANYNAIDSWSGTFDVKEHTRDTHSGRQHERISHSSVEFFAEPGRDRIRINNRSVEPVRLTGNPAMTPGDEAPESRWVRTPEASLCFQVSELRHTVKGLPRIEAFGPGEGFRVLSREPAKAIESYVFQGYVDPLKFFSPGGRQSWEMCSMLAGVLRGEQFPDRTELMKKALTLHMRREGGSTVYVLSQRFKPFEGDHMIEWVFSSDAGLNVVSVKFSWQGQYGETRQYKFRKEQGVFIPTDVEHKRYDDDGDKQSKRLPSRHCVYTLKQTKVNEPIDPAMFEVQTMGLERGDRFVDRIEHRMDVFDGEKLVPASEFKQLPSAEVKQRASEVDESTKNMKQIGLAMHIYYDAHKSFPARAIFDDEGKPLLSWRVHMLPYVEQNGLYQEFHLDEPWDSPHNRELISKIPTVFRNPASKAPAGETTYLVPTGPGSLFEGNEKRTMMDCKDGTSDTIMLVETPDAQAVIWTKPDDFDRDPLELIDSSTESFLVGLADGSVRPLWASIEPDVLKALFTRDGGESVNLGPVER